jgi:hypothetical protein
MVEIHRREEFGLKQGKKKGKKRGKRGCRPKGDDKNIRFWHFKDENGDVLDGDTLSRP